MTPEKQESKEAEPQPRRPRKETEQKELSPIDKSLLKFEDSLDSIAEQIEEHPVLKNVKAHVVNEEEPDFSLVTEGMKELLAQFKNAKKGIASCAQELKKAPAAQRERIRKAIDEKLKKFSESFDPVMNALKEIKEKQDTLAISPLKRFFYLADGTQKEELLTTTPQDFHPYIEQHALAITTNTAPNILSIIKEWDELNDTFKKDFTELLPQQRRRRQ